MSQTHLSSIQLLPHRLGSSDRQKGLPRPQPCLSDAGRTELGAHAGAHFVVGGPRARREPLAASSPPTRSGEPREVVSLSAAMSSLGTLVFCAGPVLADEVAEATSAQASPLQYLIALSPGIAYLSFAFLRGDFSSARAKASHILVKTEEEALALKTELDGGAVFTELAKANSTCPSAPRGGSLGEFKPGQMVKEFNDVVFNEEIGVVHGPIQTDFGYHLILIEERTS